MAKVSYPTTRTIKGPLLVEIAHLEALDQIFEVHLARMREYKETRIKELVARKVRKLVLEGNLKEERAKSYEEQYTKDLRNDYEFRESRSVSLYLTKGREIEAARLPEAMSQPVGEDEVVVGLSASMRVGDLKARVEIADRWSTELTVKVEPNDNEVAQGLFGSLSNWASGIETPKWQQKWLEFKWLAEILLVMFLIVASIFVPFSNWSEAGKSAAKEEARKLLAAGQVNDDNEKHAIELLLAIESDYRPSSISAPPLGLKYWGYVSLIAIVGLSITIYPSICIGLWKGRRRLRVWRLWMRTLTIGIPTLVGLNVLVPWLLHWMKLLPPSP